MTSERIHLGIDPKLKTLEMHSVTVSSKSKQCRWSCLVVGEAVGKTEPHRSRHVSLVQEALVGGIEKDFPLPETLKSCYQAM